MAEQSNASLWHCGAKQRCGEAMDDLPAAAKQRKRSIAMRWNCLEQYRSGKAQPSIAARSGLSVQSAEMLRRGKETLSIAKAKQALASRSGGIEKRRRDLQRHCIATLVMAVAKHGPAWQCQGSAKSSEATATAKQRYATLPTDPTTKSNHHNQFKEKGEQHENHQTQAHLYRADPRHLPDQ